MLIFPADGCKSTTISNENNKITTEFLNVPLAQIKDNNKEDYLQNIHINYPELLKDPPRYLPIPQLLQKI